MIKNRTDAYKTDANLLNWYINDKVKFIYQCILEIPMLKVQLNVLFIKANPRLVYMQANVSETQTTHFLWDFLLVIECYKITRAADKHSEISIETDICWRL